MVYFSDDYLNNHIGEALDIMLDDILTYKYDTADLFDLQMLEADDHEERRYSDYETN